VKKRILFINHEETRTGSPKILFEVAKFMKSSFDVQMVSLKKGSMHEEFRREFGDIQYPAWSYSRSAAEKTVRKYIKNADPDVVYVNSCISLAYAKEAKKIGLVDAVGYLSDALLQAKKLSGLPDDARVVVYRRTEYANDNIYNTATGQSGDLNVSLINLNLPPALSSLDPGFYYLWLPGTGSF